MSTSLAGQPDEWGPVGKGLCPVQDSRTNGDPWVKDCARYRTDTSPSLPRRSAEVGDLSLWGTRVITFPACIAANMRRAERRRTIRTVS